ncbi:uncharacterized protein BO66DRAFT_434836 [Aspergillus aculeatinus CBS 121060]|uniref:Uncharacterized protein n=1 Tax=Aspergillus aculeatinus CBS 121060 TaxID=1448322 RepID=A0ACD1HKF8_9EURO|nr:hypothetical protein BO66DRAFT_434836 [Aspergillus aculeatinus CBS 121060]RAH73843.1 hypothetical protein BO66DRAFT_434836 [Aspergillus aculeatinus CBS 121060]
MPSPRRVKKNHKGKARHSSDPSVIFFIPELLEAILLNLDMHTLLISTRVCFTWKDLITSSRKIQQALYYVPVEPQRKPRKNPLVGERSGPNSSTRNFTRNVEWEETIVAGGAILTLHPKREKKRFCALRQVGGGCFSNSPRPQLSDFGTLSTSTSPISIIIALDKASKLALSGCQMEIIFG